MRAGALRSLVILQAPSTEVDEIGQPIPGWSDVAMLYADIRYQSGLSAIKAGADVSLSKVSIRIRYRDVSPAQRIKHGATVFAIQAVLPDARRVFVDLVAEVVA